MLGLQRWTNGGSVDIVSFVWKTLYSDIYFKIYQRLLSIVLKNIAFIDGMMPHIGLTSFSHA